MLLKKASLKTKCERIKAQYEGALREFSEMAEQIRAQELIVETAKAKMQSTSDVPAPDLLPDIATILQGVGVTITPEQVAAVARQFQAQVAVPTGAADGLQGNGPQSQTPGAQYPPAPALGVRMPVDLTAVEELSPDASADIIRSLRQDLIQSQQLNVVSAQKIQRLETALNSAPAESSERPDQSPPEGGEPASKKLRSGDADSGTGANRSRSPKNRTKETAEDAAQKV